MTDHDASAGPPRPPASDRELSAPTHVTLRSPAELADALPYLLGFHPNDSIVLMALHGEGRRFGGRLRLGIPVPEDWPDVSDQLAETLVTGCLKRGTRPDGIVLYLCQDPADGETSEAVMERLRPLAQRLRIACGALDVPVVEALCLSDGRFWSYCCSAPRCCPPEGTPLALPGTTVMAAAAAYVGIRVRGTLREMEARLSPRTGPWHEEQRRALDTATSRLLPRVIAGECWATRQETLDLAERLVDRLHETPAGADGAESDARDDALLTTEETATLVIGLQDRVARDRAAEWMEGPRTQAVLRLWRALARRCVPPYTEHAAAPLTLAGWVAWSSGEQAEARVALGRALTADPDYLFAQLLHHACNEGLDPETLRDCLRRERADRAVCQAARAADDPRPPTGETDTDATRPAAPSGGQATVPRARRRKPADDATRPKRATGGTAAGGPTGKPRARRQPARGATRDRR
ncbi:DUF4192 domain-containing protein [Streptomyces sp. NPDC021100]|uniref:DUF4192 domain-containing protein n=1 Tax=Streptomyces sp. NPDC021100 TaxID=3365114 RepID=UPI0037A71F5E